MGTKENLRILSDRKGSNYRFGRSGCWWGMTQELDGDLSFSELQSLDVGTSILVILNKNNRIHIDSRLGQYWVGGDAGVPAVLLHVTCPTASSSRNLHLCEQDYHKLLEFFVLDSVPSMSLIYSGVWGPTSEGGTFL